MPQMKYDVIPYDLDDDFSLHLWFSFTFPPFFNYLTRPLSPEVVILMSGVLDRYRRLIASIYLIILAHTCSQMRMLISDLTSRHWFETRKQ